MMACQMRCGQAIFCRQGEIPISSPIHNRTLDAGEKLATRGDHRRLELDRAPGNPAPEQNALSCVDTPGSGRILRMSRDRIEFPRNAIRIEETDILIMGLRVFFNSMVAYPCCI